MRDFSKSRTGFDRVLMTVAATFLTVSAGAAFAQNDPVRNSAAELAIDAAIPRPEPAVVRPISVEDFKPETTASVPTNAKPADAAVGTAPTDVVKPATQATATPADAMPAPAAEIVKTDTPASTTVTAPPESAAIAPAAAERQRAGQSREQCATGGSAGRRQTA